MDFNFFNKGMATIVVYALGGLSMEITDGDTGIGWDILDVLLIWRND